MPRPDLSAKLGTNNACNDCHTDKSSDWAAAAIEGSKAYFDTNTSNHNHFLLEPTGDLMDIPGDAIRVEGLPEPPEGMRITHVDVVVRLSKA